jgi:hypothetical protein
MVWIWSIWLRIGTGGWLMWMRWWTSGFHKMLWSSWVAAQLAASQEGLSSMSEWVNNVTCRGDLQGGFWIGWLNLLTPHTHTTRNYSQYSAIADLHTLQFTVTHALGFPNFTSCILETGLQQSHCHFKSHRKPCFHSLIPFLPFLLNHIRLPSPELDPFLDNNWLKWTLLQPNSLRSWQQLTAPLQLPVVWPRGEPHGKHCLLLSRIVLRVFTDPLPSNKRPIVARFGSRGNMFTESLPSNGYTCHNDNR